MAGSDATQTELAKRTTWTFVTNHAAVLMLLARDPDIKLSELALRVGITDRAVQRVVRDLADEGYVSVEKRGRRNRYVVATSSSMRHPVVRDLGVEDLLGVLRTT